jgi:GWxTD domain-containing protein
VPDAGELDFRKAEDRYRAALAADALARGRGARPHGAALRARPTRGDGAARHRARPGAGPASRGLWFSLGLALHRLDRDDEAAQAFDSALARSRRSSGASILDLESVLRPKDADEYKRLNDAERTQVDSTFWSLADPLKLTDVNEARVEFLSRVAYADLRFSSAEFGHIGWRTDRGTVVLRYGEPPVIAAFAPATAGLTESGAWRATPSAASPPSGGTRRRSCASCSWGRPR